MTKQKRSLLRKALLAVKAAEEIDGGEDMRMVHVDYSLLTQESRDDGSLSFEGTAKITPKGGETEFVKYELHVKGSAIKVLPIGKVGTTVTQLLQQTFQDRHSQFTLDQES